MTCREFVDVLDDYLSGSLPAPVRVKFERHLADCPDCPAYLESYRRTVRLAKAAWGDPGGPVPADVPDELLRAVLAAYSEAARPGP